MSKLYYKMHVNTLSAFLKLFSLESNGMTATVWCNHCEGNLLLSLYSMSRGETEVHLTNRLKKQEKQGNMESNSG